jgi:hypothetical protein
VCATFGVTGTAASVLDIKTLSTHADRVSGGDVLVQITLDQSQAVAVTLNGNDVSSAFHMARRRIRWLDWSPDSTWAGTRWPPRTRAL